MSSPTLEDVQREKLLAMCSNVPPTADVMIREEFIKRAKALVEFLAPSGGDADARLYGEDLYDVFVTLDKAVRFSSVANAKSERDLK